jgi:hypothetical protein
MDPGAETSNLFINCRKGRRTKQVFHCMNGTFVYRVVKAGLLDQQHTRGTAFVADSSPVSMRSHSRY